MLMPLILTLTDGHFPDRALPPAPRALGTLLGKGVCWEEADTGLLALTEARSFHHPFPPAPAAHRPFLGGETLALTQLLLSLELV